jgi:hypothetical protein
MAVLFIVDVVFGHIFFLRFVGMGYLFVWRGYVASRNVWISCVSKELVSSNLEVLYYIREETTFKLHVPLSCTAVWQ